MIISKRQVSSGTLNFVKLSVTALLINIIYLVGPYYSGPKWRYFSLYGVKRADVICFSIRV